MEREKLKKILENYYKNKDGKPTSMVDHVLRGTRKPRYENIIDMENKHKIPSTVWLDIKSYLKKEEKK